MGRKNIIFEVCSKICNLLKKWLINNDIISIFFYLPSEADKYISTNSQSITKINNNKNEIKNYKLAVKDIRHLDRKFNNIEVALRLTESYVPSRSNLVIKIREKRFYSLKALLALFGITISFIIILIYLILSNEYYCINKKYFNSNDRKSNSKNPTINNNNKTNSIVNNIFWYCNSGECKVEVGKEWSRAKKLRILHLIIFHGLIIIYKYYLLFTFKQIRIRYYTVIFIIILLKYSILFYIFVLNYKNNEICSLSKGEINIYTKEGRDNYDLLSLLVNLLLDKYIY